MLAKKIIVSNTAAAILAALTASTSAQAAEQLATEPGQSADPTQQQPQVQPTAPALTVTEDGTQITAAGTSPALKDQTSPDDPSPVVPPTPKARPFAGTQVFLQTSMYTGTVFKQQQQNYNPTVDQSVFLQPRFALNRDFQLRGRLVFTYEFTDSDTTATKREPRFSDTSVQLVYRGIPDFKGIKPIVGVQLGVPTSSESRARSMYLAPGLTAQLAKTFEHVLGGEVSLLTGAVYTHPLYQYTTAGTRGETPYPFQCYGASSSCDGQLTGIANASDTLSFTGLIAGEWGKWSPALFFLSAHQWAYTFSDVSGVGRLGDRTNVRQSTYFSAWVDYHVNAWLTAEVGYFMQRNVLSESGKYGNPFFDRYQDTRVYLGANFNIDSFIQTVVEKGEADAGIIRAKNNRGPSLTAF